MTERGGKQRAGTVTGDLVLVGGGHAHVQVLRRFMMEPLPGVRLCIVLDRHEAVYSGMVPGLVAGDYEEHELSIDVLPLARRAGARCILAAATRIDPVARRVEIAGRPALPYDVASLDVGSSVRGLEVRGVREHAVPTRPIGRFVASVEAALDRPSVGETDPLRIVVVGAGAAGLELALCAEARLRALGRRSETCILAASSELLPGGNRAMARRIATEADRRGIVIRTHVTVVAVEKDSVLFENADGSCEHEPCDVVLWAAGAAPHEFLLDGSLPTDEAGFVRVRPTLQVEGYDDLFAVGDCAAHPHVGGLPKAGVYAVRQGPILDFNLRARLRARPLRRYRPQRDFLALVNLGDRRAVGGKWGIAFQGAPVFTLKDFIDRRFMRRFQVLDPDGRPAAGFPTAESMGMDSQQMVCGGCAAKLGASPLASALERLPPPPEDSSVLIGLAQADDAAALVLPRGDVVLASVDAFRAFVDDPWLVGRVAAVNAASDVLAKGGRPRHAMALVTVPDESPARGSETLYQVLAGVRAALDPLGVSLVGGHSTSGPELFVGLSISGEPAREDRVLGLDALRANDALVLTKALGTGVLLAADMRGLARGEWIRAVTASMLRDNAAASQLALDWDVEACTDVSGFGLAGHLLEMLDKSEVDAELDVDAIPALPGARLLLEGGVRSTYHDQNAAVRGQVDTMDGATLPRRLELIFDPQTSGGLLMGVRPSVAADLVTALRSAGDTHAALIGRVVPSTGPKRRIRLRAA